ncbi:MAG: peptide deformylase [Fimbriimonadaceae bacterium]|nr:peptide deformylase [Fimbriimonadaceae bacterium]
MDVVVPQEFKHLYVTDEERPIIKVPDPRLRQTATEIVKFTKKTQLLVDQMASVMRRANGIGLAAPQLGILQRVIVIAAEGMRPTGLINPVVVKSEGEQIGEEGCLSIPGLYGDVKRAEYVEVEALDRRGREVTFELEGIHARVVLHEIDHLNGVLFLDKVDLATLHWMHPSVKPDEAE